MDDKFIAFEAMLAARDAANWTFWSMIASVAGTVITLTAVLIAWRGLHSWKDQQITTARAKWVESLVSYASGLGPLPDNLDWENSKDVDRVQHLWYECIKCWKSLEVYLLQNKKAHGAFMDTYRLGWANFAHAFHYGYIVGTVTKSELRDACEKLYNL